MDPLAYVWNMEQEQRLLRGNASDMDPDDFDADFDNTEGIATTQHLRGRALQRIQELTVKGRLAVRKTHTEGLAPQFSEAEL